MFLKRALGSDYQVRGAVVQIGPHAINREAAAHGASVITTHFLPGCSHGNGGIS